MITPAEREREDELAMARSRMRRLRAANGGRTLADRAYHYALAALREEHRDEFIGLYDRFMREHEE